MNQDFLLLFFPPFSCIWCIIQILFSHAFFCSLSLSLYTFCSYSWGQEGKEIWVWERERGGALRMDFILLPLQPLIEVGHTPHCMIYSVGIYTGEERLCGLYRRESKGQVVNIDRESSRSAHTYGCFSDLMIGLLSVPKQSWCRSGISWLVLLLLFTANI